MSKRISEPIQFSYSGERLPPGHLGPFVLTTDYRALLAERDAVERAYAAAVGEASRQVENSDRCYRLACAERDAAVKESNLRDQKWMDGIRAECGTDICFDPLEPYRKPFPPTLGEFVTGLRAERDAARAEVERLRGELGKLTTPKPIDELHEDDGEVLCVWWDGDYLMFWEVNSLLATDFDATEYTHFYPLPKIQPPAALAPKEKP